ncbi:MAG: imidazolonepropionase [Pseudomonadota bacterium]
MLIKNIGRLVTLEPGAGREGILGVIEDAAVRVRSGKIAWAGPRKKLPDAADREAVVDADGGVVMPGLIDCHTHLVHAGFRQSEFNLRSQGKSYQEIAASGGGIMSTVEATRKAKLKELFASAEQRAMEALSHGTTAIEIKTGYGLDRTAEAKMTEAIRALAGRGPQRIVGTFLGAHVVPREFKGRRGEYLQHILDDMLPAAKKSGVISACDVFVEDGAYTADEARKIGAAARAMGLGMHLHVDQFSDVGGGELAAELGALSADHLDHTSEKGMRAMARAGVGAVVLPGASFFAGRGRYPDVRKMIDLGLKVAIATDYNPGTNPSLDLWMAATIAVAQMGMTCDEALVAVTQNAASVLGLTDCGRVAVGNRADLIILDAPDEYFPLYRYGTNFVSKVLVSGAIVLG